MKGTSTEEERVGMLGLDTSGCVRASLQKGGQKGNAERTGEKADRSERAARSGGSKDELALACWLSHSLSL
eukprot:scaffold66049_cov28-Tisochrysis_lutea.AAC.2